MSGYQLDTNVISELASAAPDSNVLNFLSANNDLWIPVVALYEIEYGLRILPNGRRRRRLEAAMSAFVERYAERILRLDREAAARGRCAPTRGVRPPVGRKRRPHRRRGEGARLGRRHAQRQGFRLFGRRRRQPLGRVSPTRYVGGAVTPA